MDACLNGLTQSQIISLFNPFEEKPEVAAGRAHDYLFMMNGSESPKSANSANSVNSGSAQSSPYTNATSEPDIDGTEFHKLLGFNSVVVGNAGHAGYGGYTGWSAASCGYLGTETDHLAGLGPFGPLDLGEEALRTAPVLDRELYGGALGIEADRLKELAQEVDDSGNKQTKRTEPSVPSEPSEPSEPRKPRKAKDKQDGKDKRRLVRKMWTQEETNDLLLGCSIWGVGNWKKILTDERLKFNNRSAIDLKDRFRSSFPQQYRALYPNAKTHIKKTIQEHEEFMKNRPRKTRGRKSSIPSCTTTIRHVNPALGKVTDIDVNKLLTRNFIGQTPVENSGINGNGNGNGTRKCRKEFTAEEDANLYRGFEKYGNSWKQIKKDEELNLGHRSSSDLRDRFRVAFPDKYLEILDGISNVGRVG